MKFCKVLEMGNDINNKIVKFKREELVKLKLFLFLIKSKSVFG